MTRKLYEYRSFTFYQLRRMLDREAVTAPRDVGQIAMLRSSLDSGFRVHTIVEDADFVMLEREVEADEPFVKQVAGRVSRNDRAIAPDNGFGRSRSEVGIVHDPEDFEMGHVVMYIPSHSSGVLDAVNEWGVVTGSTMSNFVFVSFGPHAIRSVDSRSLLKPEDLWPNENLHWKADIEAAVDLHRAAT